MELKNGWMAKMAFTPSSLSLSLPERSIVIRLPIDVGRKGKEVSGWVMDQDDWSTAGWPTFQMAHTTTAAFLTNIPGAEILHSGSQLTCIWILDVHIQE